MLSILDWMQISFKFFHNIVYKDPDELFGQPNIVLHSESIL